MAQEAVWRRAGSPLQISGVFCVHGQGRVHVNDHIHICVHVSIRVHVHARLHVRVNVCIHIHVHAHLHLHVHVHDGRIYIYMFAKHCAANATLSRSMFGLNPDLPSEAVLRLHST